MTKKKFLYLIIYFFTFNSSFCQDTSSILYNLAIGASNPAFGILDLSPSSIERPKDPNNFALLLQNATDNFSIVPKNYSIEISSWVFRPQVSYSDFKSGSGWNSINQSAVLSFATTTNKLNDSVTEITRLGVGLKFSILRGKMSDDFINKNQEIKDEIKKTLTGIQKKREPLIEEEVNSNIVIKTKYEERDRIDKDITITPPEYKQKLLRDKNAEIEKLKDEIRTNVKNKLKNDPEFVELTKKLKEQVSKIQFIREGFKLDFASALAFNFKDQKDGRLDKLGFWTTFGEDFGVTDKKSTTILGLLKVITNRDSNDNWKSLSDIIKHSKTSYDIGARFIQTWSDFSFSFEGISRDAFRSDTKLKYLVNFGYNVGDNKLIVFSLGKDFDGSPYKKGDLVAALNFLLGLGSERPF